MARVPEWKMRAFDWLPIEQWTPDNLLAFYKVSGKRYCKLCDAWVSSADEKKHCAAHRKQARDDKRKRDEAAKKAREEGRKRAREEKKLLKKLGESAKESERST